MTAAGVGITFGPAPPSRAPAQLQLHGWLIVLVGNRRIAPVATSWSEGLTRAPVTV
jgi:hypothetical protein